MRPAAPPGTYCPVSRSWSWACAPPFPGWSIPQSRAINQVCGRLVLQTLRGQCFSPGAGSPRAVRRPPSWPGRCGPRCPRRRDGAAAGVAPLWLGGPLPRGGGRYSFRARWAAAPHQEGTNLTPGKRRGSPDSSGGGREHAGSSPRTPRNSFAVPACNPPRPLLGSCGGSAAQPAPPSRSH